MKPRIIAAVLAGTLPGALLPQGPAAIVEQHPAWSPDGSGIVFVSNRNGRPGLFVTDPVGSPPRSLTGGSDEASYPAWGPGRRIAFHGGADRLYALFVVDLQAGELKKLTENDFSIEPDWSPDGKWILYSSRRSGNLEIYLTSSDGATPRALTHSPASDGYPSFDPAGELVLFQSDRSGVTQLYSMSLDGGALLQRTHAPQRSMHGDWSPDGSRIVFDSERDGDREIYVLTVADGLVRRLTHSAGRDGYPKWSPDGKRIAFHSSRHGSPRVFLMEADGRRQRPLAAGDQPGI